MADKPNEKSIGGRLNLIDPNNFDNLYHGGDFKSPRYNMSVPLEDLSVTVELKTTTKNRTILTTENNKNTKINTGKGGKELSVNFITGTEDKTTGGQNYLTTNYTNASTELTDIDETLGITSIDIDFNSSYAPMVNIEFVDIKGASIFQNNGTSKYNVFFKLPYPIFELTVKGYYGKPVTYCLHLIKCTPKFNSQTGNFEISAQFVGYTYAMLSDMLIGYLKAAGITAKGQQKLSDRGVPSIREFLNDVANIDKLSKDLLKSDDEDVKNLSVLNTLRESLQLMSSQIRAMTSNGLTNNTGTSTGVKYTALEVNDVVINGINIKDTIAIIKDPNPQSGSFDDTNNKVAIDDFNKKFSESVANFNKLVIDQSNIKISETDLSVDGLVTTKTILEQFEAINPEIDTEIEQGYKVNDTNVVSSIRTRLSLASNKVTDEGKIRFYDFTDLMLIVDSRLKELDKLQADLSRAVGLKLQKKITEKLGFSSSIRNIINIFTTHVEIFLEQLFEVSESAYTDKSGDRMTQLKRWKDNLDIHKESTIIYPWPEYNENNVEKYLGSVLEIPQNVPEIAFVEEMYKAMITFDKVESDLNRLIVEDKSFWYGLSPVDSQYFNQSQTNPYQRLGTNPSFDDIARLITLRAAGFMGFSNNMLTSDEIVAFAKQESILILDQFKITENNLVKSLNQKYTSADIYAGVKGEVNSTQRSVLITGEDNDWKYNYIVEPDVKELLPITGPFDKLNGGSLLNSFVLTNNQSNRINTTQPSGATYINFVDGGDYVRNSPPTINPAVSVFSLSELQDELNSPSKLSSAGFIANAGRYGVQEFLKIDHNSSNGSAEPIGVAPFFTLFYNAGNALMTQTTTGFIRDFIYQDRIDLLSPSLCKLKTASPNYISTWDLTGGTTTLPKTSDNSLGARSTTGEIYAKYSFGKISNIYTSRADIGRNLFLLNQDIETISYPFVTFGVMINPDRGNGPDVNVELSLFGSRFYNRQSLDTRAFLFLHSLPWRGLIDEFDERKGLFKPLEILNTFQHRTGFIQVPKLYPAFIGGLLWRQREGANNRPDPIQWKIGNEYLIPQSDNTNNATSLPATDQFLRTTSTDKQASPMCFKNGRGVDYVDLDDVLLLLPDSVKEKFINEFKKFVLEYDTIRANFEIGHTTNWVADWNYLNSKVTKVKNASGVEEYKISTTEISTTLNTTDRFDVVSFIPEDDGDGNNDIGQYFKYNYFLEFKDNSAAVTSLKNIMLGYNYISNNSWVMWNAGRKETPHSVAVNLNDLDITIPKTDFSKYIEEIKKNISDEVSSNEKQKFNPNSNANEIKLEIYRTLKKIYDKWIADTSNKDNIMFQCCKTDSDRLTSDKGRKLHRLRQTDVNATDGNKPALIDSFRFVTRSFKDIGDEFQINPLIISQLLLQSTNISFYDLVGRLLSDNNFDFIALPSFVDYNDLDELRSIFTPYPYYQAAGLAKTGPSFVCVYVGQTSTKLDFGSTSAYPNDGFDLTDPTSLPEDFKGPKQDWEDVGAAFVVRYGQQNQNLFKDIVLDQAEFSETAESLQITDNIANQFSQTNQSYMGQNLYNVYSTRSYRVDVDMLGNAMIQPMMYFQLDNIPMFHGAYLITKVKHNLKPNHMSTLFSGVRINVNETPLVEAAALYSSLLSGYPIPPTQAGTVLTNGTNLSVIIDTKSLGSKQLSSTALNNQILVKDFLKNKGLSKAVAAGIMGNMMKESVFLPSAVFNDLNGYKSYGLIQWNAKFYDLDVVGTTVESQLNFLLAKTNNITTFLKDNASVEDPFKTAYEFARIVERCANCTAGYPAYLSDTRFKPFERGQYANDFYSRFNIQDDVLFW